MFSEPIKPERFSSGFGSTMPGWKLLDYAFRTSQELKKYSSVTTHPAPGKGVGRVPIFKKYEHLERL